MWLFAPWFPVCFPISVNRLCAGACTYCILSCALPCNWTTTTVLSLLCSLWTCSCRRKERKERHAWSRDRISCSLGQQKLYKSNTVCKAKSVAFPIIVAVAWDLQDRSARSSQAMDFSKLWIARVFGFLSMMQPKAYESTAQDSKASKGSQQNGYQHGRIRTWK